MQSMVPTMGAMVAVKHAGAVYRVAAPDVANRVAGTSRWDSAL